MVLLGALEACEPLHFARPTAGVLKVLVEEELLLGDATCVGEVVLGDEDGPVLDVVLLLRPAHGVVLAVLASVIHVVDDVHICAEDVAVDDVSGEGDVVEAVREEEHEHGVLIVEGQVLAEVLLLVVLVVAHHLAHEHVLLERSHVQIAHLQPASHQVVHDHVIVEGSVHFLSVPHQREIEEAGLFRADDVVVEVEVEILIHREGGYRCDHVGVFVGLVGLLGQVEIDQAPEDFCLSEVCVGDLDGACPQRDDVVRRNEEQKQTEDADMFLVQIHTMILLSWPGEIVLL